jgi:outer membrane protein assembly factor BamB
MTRRTAWFLAAASALACGDKGPATGAQDPPAAGPTAPRPPASRAPVTPAWTFGDAPTGSSGGPRVLGPDDPLPTLPSAIAVGAGRVLVATQDACVELLDLATGKPVVARQCEADRFPAGVAILGGTAIVARRDDVRGYDAATFRERWRADVGIVQTQHMVQPRAVAGRFCALTFRPKIGQAVVCLDPATGKVAGELRLPPGGRVVIGEQVIGLIDAGLVTEPSPAGHERPVRFHGPDGALVAESRLTGVRGPSFEQATPIFLVRGGGHDSLGGWITRFVGADGKVLTTATGKAILSEGGAVRGGRVVTTEYGSAGRSGTAVALDAAGAAAWRADLGGPGPIRPWVLDVGGVVHVGHDRGVTAIDDRTGAVIRRYPIAAAAAVAVNDRVLVLVEGRETRSDSDYGDAGVHIVDAATGEVLLREDLGRDAPGGQQWKAPIVLGDVVVLVAGGRVRAYRVSM